MNTSGILPRLVSSDPVSMIKNYTEQLALKLEGGAVWTNLVPATGWAAVAGYNLECRKFGKLVEVRGMVKFVSGVYTNPITTLPQPFRPTGQAAWFNPSIGTVSKAVVLPNVPFSGVVTIPAAAYTTGVPAANDLFVIHGMWNTDNTP